MMLSEAYAHTVMEWAEILGTYSEEQDRLTRRFATAALKEANEAVATWMRNAGMSVRYDNIGNVRGRYEANHDSAQTLLLGSHLDTVRDAGKYDGVLGVLIAIVCVQQLYDRGERLPFAIEVLGFADEEGLRYHTAYLGSSVISGTFDLAALERTDADGITMAAAIRAFGGDPSALHRDKRDTRDLLCYCEVHIEQGPVLETQQLPVGVVTAIQGQSRFTVRFTGEAGHAGTVPIQLRHDALCAAAEFVLRVEALGRQEPGLVTTVGQLAVEPGASNVIPSLVTLSVDVRHQEDTVRKQACRQLYEQAVQIADLRQVSLSWELVQEQGARACAPAYTQLLAQAIELLGYSVYALPSGAGHDAVMMSHLTPIAMLFVRCTGGRSHNPAEAVIVADVAVAIEVLTQFWMLLARVHTRNGI